MSISRKIYLCFMLLGITSLQPISTFARDYIYIPEHKDVVITDSQGRLFLAGTSIDLSQIWFVTGAKYFEDKDSSCLRARDLWLFTKPVRSSDGIWRGKKAYIKQEPEAACGKTIKTSPVIMDIDTVTFIDPDDQHPEEAWDGIVPGVFQIYGGITDSELSKIRDAISEVHTCVKADKCPFPVSTDGLGHTRNYQLLSVLKITELTSMTLETEYETNKPYYTMIFTSDNALDIYAVAMDIYYRNEAITKVDFNDDIVE